jgi:hypothetical protein
MSVDHRHQHTLVPLPKIHLAFVLPPVMRDIRLGHKTVESRLSVRAHPARHARPGDALLFKRGDAEALGIVRRVDRYSSTEPLPLAELVGRYGHAVGAPSVDLDYWRARAHCTHAVFLHFDAVIELCVPGSLLPYSRTGWINDYQAPLEVKRIVRAALVGATGLHG